MPELTEQIHAMVENWAGEMIDAYQCQDWGVNAETFFSMLIVYFNEYVRDLGEELDAREGSIK